MGQIGDIFGGKKLRQENGETGDGRVHDPGGPLDLDSGVVHLAPPKRQHADADSEPAETGPSRAESDAQSEPSRDDLDRD